MDKHDEWKETNTEVQGVIVDYFSDLFKTQLMASGLTEHERVGSITVEQNRKLEASITSEEVKIAVFSMHPEKSPGVDGMNPAFFQTYWTIVGLDVTLFCQNFFSTGVLMDDVNRTLVCLLPKVKEPNRMTNLRPISLCNVLMRILMKVMANRLWECLPGLISDKQGAFVEGRLLTDNALIAFELIIISKGVDRAKLVWLG